MPICNSGHRNYQRRHLQAINFELSLEPWQFADAISNPFHLPKYTRFTNRHLIDMLPKLSKTLFFIFCK